jgi:carboxypeptidase T
MKKYIAMALTAIFVTSNAFAAMHFVHLKASSEVERSKIANIIHIDQVIEDSVYAVVNEDDLLELKKKLGSLLVETHEYLPKGQKENSEEIEFPAKDEKFHTFKETMDVLDNLARKYPKIVTSFSLGSSVEGRALKGLRVTGPKNLKSDAFIPGIFFVGAHHAREHLSTEVPLLLLNHLLENYGTDKRITDLINSRDIYFVPMLNPDGAMHDIKGRKYKMWRKNRIENAKGSFGVDLNRNYSFGWGTGGSSRRETSDVFMGPKPFSEPETQAVKKFVEEHANIRIILSFHTFSELILYPWGGKKDGVSGKDGQVFTKMARTMSQWNKYKPMQASGLYVATGDTCDWAYGEHGIFCFTFELSPKSRWRGGFYPGAKVIDPAFKVNILPALYLIEKAGDPYGVLKK